MSIRQVNSFTGTTPTNTIQKAQPKFQGNAGIAIPKDLLDVIKANATGEYVPGLGTITKGNSTPNSLPSQLHSLFHALNAQGNTSTYVEEVGAEQPQGLQSNITYEWKPEYKAIRGDVEMKLTITDGKVTGCSVADYDPYTAGYSDQPNHWDLSDPQIAKQLTDIMQANYKTYSTKA